LQAVTVGDSDQPYYLKNEKVDSLPKSFFANHKNLTKLADNLILYKINLPSAEKAVQTDRMIVMEYHKGRREPFPKVIRVYEK
jgi:hypothetical protein